MLGGSRESVQRLARDVRREERASAFDHAAHRMPEAAGWIQAVQLQQQRLGPAVRLRRCDRADPTVRFPHVREPVVAQRRNEQPQQRAQRSRVGRAVHERAAAREDVEGIVRRWLVAGQRVDSVVIGDLHRPRCAQPPPVRP